MTHQEFKNKYLGQRLDYDGVAAYQCVDIAKAYGDYVWGAGHIGALGGIGGAIEAYNLFPNGAFKASFCTRTANNFKDVNQCPKQGDIIVFGATVKNAYGHIGIVEKVYPGQNKVDIIEQNGVGTGNGTGGDAIRVFTRTYTASGGVGKVLGWLSKIEAPAQTPAPTPTPTPIDTRDQQIKDLQDLNSKKASKILELEQVISTKESEFNTIKVELDSEKKLNEGWNMQVQQARQDADEEISKYEKNKDQELEEKLQDMNGLKDLIEQIEISIENQAKLIGIEIDKSQALPMQLEELLSKIKTNVFKEFLNKLLVNLKNILSKVNK
jgi:surface antigen